MAVLREVVRGGKKYYYLVETYRRDGKVHRKERYLGTEIPRNLNRLKGELEGAVWGETWFRDFLEIRRRYQARQRALPTSVLTKERSDFVAEFTYDTNRIEGSTLTFEETFDLLSKGMSPKTKPMSDVREAQLHGELLANLLEDSEPIDLHHLLAWHRAIFHASKPDIAGRLRDYDVRISHSRHLPPSPVEVRPMLVESLRRLSRSQESTNGVERAARFHWEFESIHPFGDGNGRLGRLAMNLVLMHSRYPMLNIRYGRRGSYYRALERSDLKSDPRPFLLWFFRRYRSEHRGLLSGDAG